MKKISVLIISLIIFTSCKKQNENASITKDDFVSFGEKISSEGAITKEEMLAKYGTLKPGDTIQAKFSSKIKEVCQKKGCWMNIDLGSGKSAFVKFKDYAFFVPKNAAESDAIVNGKAFVEITSINDLKEYAKDASKSKAAIDSIVTPETNYSFLASGVLIKK